MADTKTKTRAVKAAAVAYSDLNTFAIAQAIMESGFLHSSSYKGAERIIKICLAEQQKRLREYDRAVRKAGS